MRFSFDTVMEIPYPHGKKYFKTKMKLPSSAIDHEVAMFEGYRPLTDEYSLPKESSFLSNVMRDLDQGGKIDYVLVGTSKHCAIYRKGMCIQPTITNKMPMEKR